MREIKFRRAFFKDEDKKQFSHFGEWGVNLKDGITFVSPSSNNYAPYFIDHQYTGLKDKTGCEICEGDILKGYGSAIKRFVVSFSEGSFVLYHNFGRWGLLSRMFEIEELPVEVIGNIYENPELCQ